jgi:hypothetical protein
MEAFIPVWTVERRYLHFKIDPDFDVLTLIIKHFKKSLQDPKWIIYDLRHKYGVYYDLNDRNCDDGFRHQIVGW